jgi:hypothetical protein
MATLFLHPQQFPESGPIHLNVHVVTTLDVSAEEARRQVNRDVVTELGTGLIAREPELVISGEHVVWRVPIVLSLPELGEMGQVGTVDVDARSGELLTDPDAQQGIIQHARRLYAGATLPTE